MSDESSPAGSPSSFRLKRLDHDIAVLTFDEPGSKVNTLSTRTLGELDAALSELDAWEGIRGLLLRSGKPGQCVAGADLKEVARLAEGPEEPLAAFFDLGHAVMGRLAALPYPSVALVDGPALGGGLELLLACDGRVAGDAAHTRLGLPEVKLGLIPAWAGTQRLPRLIGPEEGLVMVVSGAPKSAHEAAEPGLVDAVVATDRLVESAIRLVEEWNATGTWRERREARSRGISLESSQRDALRTRGESLITRMPRGEGIAARAALDVVLEGILLPLAEGVARERQAALKLFRTEAARNMVFGFFLRQRKSREAGRIEASASAREVKLLGVIGAGQMGTGIAAVACGAGVPVVLVELDPGQRARAFERVKGICARAGRSTDFARQVRVVEGFDAIVDCDLVVEAVTEDEARKHEVLRRVDELAGPDAVIATNTSSLGVGRLAQSIGRPERFVGLHFFHPVARMELVELVRGPASSDTAIATAARFARLTGKLPLLVGDGPGFLVNRLLFPYLHEALLLREEGCGISQIDEWMEGFGWPMGPYRLMDYVGLDTILAIFRVLGSSFSEWGRGIGVLEERVSEGHLGVKAAGGFYHGESLDARFLFENKELHQRQEATDRLLLRMVLEATRAMEEQVASDADSVDLATLLGLGFPPWRGGLLRWVDRRGLSEVLIVLERLRALGERYKPTDLLIRMGRAGVVFHGRDERPVARRGSVD